MSAWKSAEAVVGRNFLATLRGDDGTTASSPEKLQAAAGQASHRLLQGARFERLGCSMRFCVDGGSTSSWTLARGGEALDIHIRRHLPKSVWIAWKRPKTREREPRRRGLDKERAWKSANNGRGAWWNADALHMRDAFPKSFFRRQGLYSLLEMR